MDVIRYFNNFLGLSYYKMHQKIRFTPYNSQSSCWVRLFCLKTDMKDKFSLNSFCWASRLITDSYHRCPLKSLGKINGSQLYWRKEKNNLSGCCSTTDSVVHVFLHSWASIFLTWIGLIFFVRPRYRKLAIAKIFVIGASLPGQWFPEAPPDCKKAQMSLVRHNFRKGTINIPGI